MNYLKVEQPKIYESYHLSWANKGCVWQLRKLNEDGSCLLITHKTRKLITARIEDLRHIRQNENNPH